MKQFLIVLTMFVSGNSATAQTSEDSVKAVINKMFLAMKEGNGDNVKSTFSDSIVFQSIAPVRVKRRFGGTFSTLIGAISPVLSLP